MLSIPDYVIEWLAKAAAERLDLVIAEKRLVLAETDTRIVAHLAALDEKNNKRIEAVIDEVKSAIAMMYSENVKNIEKFDHMIDVVDAKLSEIRDGKDGANGLDGKDGATGIQGEKGDTGKTGDAGPPGPRGEPGIAGERGDQGEKGDVGELGEKGDTGDRGDPGEKGERGEKGDPGLNGKDGEPGDMGSTGPVGDMGEKGERGEKGDPGLNGKDGLDGITPENAEFFIEDGGRIQGFKFGEKITRHKTAAIVYRGIWKDGNVYEPGDQVTLGGSIWICEKETNTRPGAKEGQKAWTLSAKRGHDGKDGKPGERGPEGKEGQVPVELLKKIRLVEKE